MGYRVIWSDMALARVGAIADYIALDSPPAAASFVEGLFDRVAQAGEHPRLAPAHPLVDDETIRQWVYRAHVVAYKVNDPMQSLTVLMVRHSKQRPESLD